MNLATCRTIVAILLLVSVAGCATAPKARTYINPETDFSFYNRVGILPFRNLTDDKLASEKLTETFGTEILIASELAIMDQGQFNAVVAQVARANPHNLPADLSSEQLSQIGDVAQVQGIFAGTIHDYRMLPVGGESYPFIAMTMKFIDAPTGTVVWQSQMSVAGGPNLPIVSIGEIFTLGELSQKLCKNAIENFYKNVRK